MHFDGGYNVLKDRKWSIHSIYAYICVEALN